MSAESLDAAFFERMYESTDDPWSFATSAYEAQKYEATLAALPSATYGRAFEIGCSIGVLTARLAKRCASLLSVDVNAKALASARKRCEALTNVSFAKMAVPGSFPDEHFDLIVVSEVGYYLSDLDLALLKDRICASSIGGTVELVHFLPKVPEYPRDGDSVHESFRADARFTSLFAERAERYRIDVMHVG